MRRKLAKRLSFAASLAASIAALVWLLGAAFNTSEPHGRPYSFPPDAFWIRVKDDTQRTGCFRKDLFLPGKIKHAWVVVASEGGFELTVNSNPVGAFTYWRSTRAFNNGLNAAGQWSVTSNPSIAYNFPREYQWTSHENHRLPVFFDIRKFLTAGKNSISVETIGRWTGVAFCLSGLIELEDGTLIPIRSNEAWKGEPVPKNMGQREWTRTERPLDPWDNAIRGRRFSGTPLTFVPRGMFETTFQGQWLVASGLAHKGSNVTGQDFVYEWNQEDGIDDAWVKVASRAPYMLYVNDVPIQPPSRAGRGLGEGGWMVKWRGRRPLEVFPTLLDPDETAEALVGYRFTNPRHGDPTVNNFRVAENTMNRTREREAATKPGELTDDRRDPDEPRGTTFDPYGVLEEGWWRIPPNVLRERGGEQLHGYGIAPILKKGKNTIRLRVLEEPQVGYKRSRPIAVALHGQIKGNGGSLTDIRSDPSWRSEWENEPVDYVAANQVGRAGSAFPRLSYIGEQRSERSWKAISLFIAAISGLFLIFSPWRPPNLQRFSLGFFLTIFLLVFFKYSLFERSESLWFRTPLWPWLYLSGGILGGLTLAFLQRWKPKSRKKIPSWAILTSILVLCLLARAYRIIDQPIDDDEYASIQAVLSIAEKGIPEIGQGIWYSRSPGYHYLAGLFAFLFGSNLWVFRMVSVLAALATAILVWKMARIYFHNRWIAGATALLFAVHPFLIFTGHIARFYQQQQFFLILLLHAFIKGFIVATDVKWRVYAIFAFGLAVLSQEISISFVPILVVLYVLFGRDVNWRWEVKSILTVAFVGAAIAIDILLFQMKCMTRPVGISPNVEATISPNFWELGNLAAMFIGYSRLHVLLSVFWLVSLVWSLRSGLRRPIALHASLLIGVLFLNLLITSPSFRYQYTLIPLWILLGAHGIWLTFEYLGRWTKRIRAARTLRWAALALVIASWSPWRIPGSYDEKILGDPISGLRYVKANIRDGDKVMITEPHPHAAKIEVGRVDYDLVVPILYDFTYSDNGLLRDRNGDAEVVNRIGQLQEIFAEDERVWILLNREKFRSRKRNIRWEYPTAREELFIRENCRLVYRSYLWHVYLWDRNLGKYHAFRSEPGGWSE
ncbi:MAG: glycosyltransferase family 39 protein [Verrucomicrobiota bacterium]